MGREVEEELRAFVAARFPHLRRTAYLLCGDWHRADDPCASKGTLEACLRVRGAGPVLLYL
jgi:hypothetical protein